jgi:hypothetical protein
LLPPLGGAKVAVTDSAASIVTEQLEIVPEHAPDQPLKVPPDAAVAESVTTVPGSNALVQVVPQEMPEGLDVTVPDPDSVTLNVGRSVKWAFAVRAAVTCTVHVEAVPVHAPVHPPNTELLAGAVVNTTAVPCE